MGVFVAEIRPRWSDMDAYGHVNHANTVTLLEEARVDLLLEGARHGVTEIANGVVVARLVVDYHAPLLATGHKVRVEISVREMHNISFTLDYSVYSGLSTADPVAATAETRLVPFDLTAGRSRRLSAAEHDFLASWRTGGGSA